MVGYKSNSMLHGKYMYPARYNPVSVEINDRIGYVAVDGSSSYFVQGDAAYEMIDEMNEFWSRNSKLSARSAIKKYLALTGIWPG